MRERPPPASYGYAAANAERNPLSTVATSDAAERVPAADAIARSNAACLLISLGKGSAGGLLSLARPKEESLVGYAYVSAGQSAMYWATTFETGSQFLVDAFRERSPGKIAAGLAN